MEVGASDCKSMPQRSSASGEISDTAAPLSHKACSGDPELMTAVTTIPAPCCSSEAMLVDAERPGAGV